MAMLEKKTAFVAGLAVVGLTITACAGAGGSSSDTIKLGIEDTVSGQYAGYGTAAYDVYKLAVSLQNQAGGINGKQIEAVNLDSKGDPAVAAQVARRFVDQDVAGVVGEELSPACLSAMPVYSAANVPFVIGGCSAPAITTQGYKNIFQTFPADPLMGAKGGEFAASDGMKTASVITDSSDSSRSLVAGFTKAFEAAGGQVLTSDQITSGNVDFTTTVNKIVSKHPDVVYFGGLYPEGAILAQELAAADPSISFQVAGNSVDPAFTNVAKNAAVGVMTVVSQSPQDSGAGATFIDAYTKAYGRAPGHSDAVSWDAIQILFSALKTVSDPNDHAAVLAAIRATDVDGVSGQLKFDATGARAEVGSLPMLYDATLKLVPWTKELQAQLNP